MECKIDNTARVALEQIKEKEYALPWAMDEREKVLIGVNFSTRTRRPDGWVIERGDGSVVEHSGHDGEHDSEHDENLVIELILAIGDTLKSREELARDVNIGSRRYFYAHYLNPAIDQGYVERSLPDKPKSKKQRYYLTEKGLALLEELKKNQ